MQKLLVTIQISFVLYFKQNLLILRLLPNHGGCHRAGLQCGLVNDCCISSELNFVTQSAAKQAGPRGAGGGLLCCNVLPATGERMTEFLLVVLCCRLVLYNNAIYTVKHRAPSRPIPENTSSSLPVFQGQSQPL